MDQKLRKELSKVAREVDDAIDNILKRGVKPERLYNASGHLIHAGGKRLRPFLAIKACELVGGQREDAIPAAAAIELIHAFTLIHDDIMDRDNKRRGVPTVHNLWGIPIAIIAGDMLFAKAYEALLFSPGAKRVSPSIIRKILTRITNATISICEGQALDIIFEGREVISETEYFEMIGRKTATLLKAASEVGAIMGGGKLSQIRSLGRFAYDSGLAFQVMDDILGLTSKEKIMGKTRGSDIRKGKRTLIMTHSLTHASKRQLKHIFSVLGREDASKEEIEEIIQIISSLGSIDYAFTKAQKLIVNAKNHLSSFPSSPPKEILLNLADYMITRKR